MKQRIYAGWEERTAELLWERLGTMTLVKDEEGKPIKYEKVYPPIKQLIKNCKKEKIKLPENPEIKDILIAMVKAGHTQPQRDASAQQAIKSLSERVFEKAIKDGDLSQEKVSFRLKEVPEEQEEAPQAQQEAQEAADQADLDRKAAEQAKIDAKQEELEAERDKKAAEQQTELEQAKIDAKQAKLEAEQYKKQARKIQQAAEQAKLDLEQSEEAEIEAEIKAVEHSAKAEQAQREADKKATQDKE